MVKNVSWTQPDTTYGTLAENMALRTKNIIKLLKLFCKKTCFCKQNVI